MLVGREEDLPRMLELKRWIPLVTAKLPKHVGEPPKGLDG